MSPAMVPPAGDYPSLAALVSRLSSFLADQLEHLEPRVSVTQLAVMEQIAAGATLTAELAARTGLSPNAASAIVKRLTGKGVVAREPGQGRGRAAGLTLTPTGRLLLADRAMRIERALSHLIGAGGAERRAVIEHAAGALHAALDLGQGEPYSVGTASA
ncbi:MarR family transcriptional regulator [bacterium]|nr:MAG: MarR family transcriptional regulator [bacterium]